MKNNLYQRDMGKLYIRYTYCNAYNILVKEPTNMIPLKIPLDIKIILKWIFGNSD